MLEHPPSKILSQSTKYSGNWLSLKTMTLEVNGKKIHEYEYIEPAPSKKANKDLDGVSMVPIIKSKSSKAKKVVIVANFRPPTNNYVLEFPGGIVENESYEEDALRELKEETGYRGSKIINSENSFPCYYDAWKSKENGRLLIVEIDGDEEENRNPTQKLDKDEVIKVFLLDFDNRLVNHIQELSKKYGFGVSDQLYSFAMGICFCMNFGFGLPS